MNSNYTFGLNNVEYYPTNLLNGNTLLFGFNIITVSNKADYICYVSPPSTTVFATTTSVKKDTVNYYISSKKGLSTGAIISGSNYRSIFMYKRTSCHFPNLCSKIRYWQL